MEPPGNFEKFRDDVFLSHHTLDDKTALEYFYGSQFFDTSSLNQKRRRGLQISEDAEGIDYRLVYQSEATRPSDAALATAQWNLPNQFGTFVIQKFSRDTKGTETPLECYYILGGTIFKAPSLGGLIRQRTLRTVKYLDSLMDDLTSMATWSLIEGYCWGKVNVASNSDSSNLATPEGSTPRAAQEAPFLLEDLCTKRPCTDASRVIEDCFSSFANASLKFNAHVDKLRNAWQVSDEAWKAAGIQSLRDSRSSVVPEEPTQESHGSIVVMDEREN